MTAIASLLPTTETIGPSLLPLRPLLGRCRAFYPTLAAISGSTKAGVLLSQLLYWARHPPEGAEAYRWIRKTAEEWQAETGLTAREQSTARAYLCARGLIEVVRRGVPACLHYRLQPAAMLAALRELTDKEEGATDSLEGRLGAPQPHYQILTALTGNLHAGLLLSRAIHYLRHAESARERAGYLRATAASREALGLSRRAWEGARRDLVARGCWIERLVGAPARLEIRVLLAPLREQLSQFERDQTEQVVPILANGGYVQNVTTRTDKTANLVVTKPPRQLSENRPASYDETAELLKKQITNYRVQPPPEDLGDRKTACAQGGGREDLIFPPGLDPGQRSAAREVLRDCTDVAQALLDELSARLQAKEIRRSPIGYLRALVQRYLNGNFTPELGARLSRARQRRADEESARQSTLDTIATRRRESGTAEHAARVAKQRAALGQLMEQIRRRPAPASGTPPMGQTVGQDSQTDRSRQ